MSSIQSSADITERQRLRPGQLATYQAYEDACTAPTRARIASVADTMRGLRASRKHTTGWARTALDRELILHRIELEALKDSLRLLKAGAIDADDICPF